MSTLIGTHFISHFYLHLGLLFTFHCFTPSEAKIKKNISYFILACIEGNWNNNNKVVDHKEKIITDYCDHIDTRQPFKLVWTCK